MNFSKTSSRFRISGSRGASPICLSCHRTSLPVWLRSLSSSNKVSGLVPVENISGFGRNKIRYVRVSSCSVPDLPFRCSTESVEDDSVLVIYLKPWRRSSIMTVSTAFPSTICRIRSRAEREKSTSFFVTESFPSRTWSKAVST